MSNAILNPDRTRKNIVSVSEETARSTECPINILETDIFVENVPAIPDDLFLPKLLEDNVTWVEGDTTGKAANNAIILAKQIRVDRDQLLTESDWTQIPDAPLDAATKAAWVSYRQALRDIPLQSGFPDIIDWPIAPN